MAKKLRLLIIEDSDTDLQLVVRELTKEYPDVVIDRAITLEEVQQKVSRETFDAILADYSLPTCDGQQILAMVRSLDPVTPLIIISGTVGEDIAVQMLKLGANDYILKHNLKRLSPALGRELRASQVIREKIAAQKTIEEREAQLTAIVEQAMDAIISFNKRREIVLFNASAEEMFGKTRGEMIGRPLETLFPAQSFREIEAILSKKQKKRDKADILFELKGVGPSDETFPIEASLSIENNGAASSGTLILRDLRERKKLEQRLREAQKLEVVGEMAVGIAHDLNNILAAVIGYSQAALCEKKNVTQLQSNLSAINKAAMRGRGIIRRILTFGSKVTTIPEVVDLKSAIEEVVSILNASLPSSVHLNVDHQIIEPKIFVDPNQVHQIILNLCTNAIAAVEGKTGRVEIRTELVSNSANGEPEETIKISISDNGIGMTKELQDRIFEPFFTTKEKGRGSGLGLSVVRSIVKELNGTIEVVSSEGQGSTFSVALPRCLGALQNSENECPGYLEGNEHVLLVDDEPMIIDLVKQMLEILGYRVTSFSKVHDALTYFHDHATEIDLIFSDETMPEMNGTQFVREARGSRGDIPALFSTGFGILKEGNGELDFWIGKPFTMAEMGQQIRSIFDRPNKKQKR